MAEFKLGRIRFVWKGAWVTGTTYYKDDVVRFGGKVYLCQVGHTASSDFNTDLDIVPTKWNLMADGQRWTGDWATSTVYEEGDLVKYGGTIYVCIDGHTSAATAALGLETNSGDWNTFVEGTDWKGNWAVSTRYKLNDIVRYGGINYICITGHTSAATAALGLENGSVNWQVYTQGQEYLGTWVTSTRYKLNDIVKYGAGLWICTTQHTAGGTFAGDSSNWSQYVEGLEYESNWSSGTAYQPGDVVKYGGNNYVAKTQHTNVNPVTGTSDWDLFAEGLSYQADWVNTTSYKIGEVVKLNGYNYLAIADSPSYTYTVTASAAATDRFTTSSTSGMVAGMSVRFTGTTFGGVFTGGRYYIKEVIAGGTDFTITTTPGGALFDASAGTGSMTAVVSPEPTNTNYWAVISHGVYWRGDWADDTEYNPGDAVKYGTNSYICVLAHRAEGDDGSTLGVAGGGQSNSRPDLDTNGTYWNLLTLGDEISVLTTVGDMVYYGGSGPARLPVGTEGQILRVGSAGIPEWVTWGNTEHVYYVSPTGEDRPYPACGATLDKPWKSIRYACEQVEQGALNPNAQHLLELNRVFIQKEVTSWIDYQIANAGGTGIWNGFDYDEYKCERDVGFLVDRLVWDLGHGGNLKMRAAAQSYVNALGAAGEYSETTENQTYSKLSTEADNDVAAFNYMKTLVTKVLNNQVPTTVYQNVTNDSTAIVEQYINTDYVAETGVATTASTLIDIVITALTDQNADNLPARSVPNNTINIKTGQYRETLPIIVPAETVLLGDEVRSTNAGPAGSLIDRSDAQYSIAALGRLETIIGQIIVGTNVTETSGNTEVQSAEFPFASSAEVTTASQLVRVMQQQIDWKLGTTHLVTLTDPVNYNTVFLAGYGDARTLLQSNKEFIKDEITAWIAVNYPEVKYSKTACRRDVGYIVDAINYDLTYGGSHQTLVAGLAYFDGNASSTLMIDSTELAATSAAYSRLKTVLQQIASNTTVTKSTGNTATQVTDGVNYPDGSNASSTIGDLVDIIIDIIAGDSTRSLTPQINVTQIASTQTFTSTGHTLTVGDAVIPRVSANGLVAGRKYWVSATATNTFDLAATYGGSTITTFTNGTGLDIDLETIDYPTATNGVTSTTALITAATTLDAAQESIVQNVIDDLNATAWHTDFVVDSTSLTSTQFRVYVGKSTIAHTYVSGGTVTKPDGTELAVTGFTYNESTGYAVLTTATHGLSAGDIVEIQNITVSCLSSGGTPMPAIFPSETSTDGSVTKVRYVQNKCIRDVRLITEAVMFDFMFNSNFQTIKAAYSYLRSSAVDVFTGGQKAITRAALTNAKTEAKSNVGGNTTAQARIETLMTLLDDILYGATNEGSICQTDSRDIDYAILQLERNRNYIVAEISAWMDYNYVNFDDYYNSATCARDIGYIIDAVVSDLATGSNFSSSVAGEAYYRVQSELVTSAQMMQTVAAVKEAKRLATFYVTDSSLYSAVNAAFDNVVTILSGGLTAVPTYTWPDNGTSSGTDVSDAAALQTNRATMVTGIETYLSTTAPYSTVWAGLTLAQQNACKRDVGYMIDAVTYDLQYGGNYQSTVAGSAYYSFGTLEIATGEKAATLAAVTQLATLMKAYTSSGGDTKVDTLTGVIYGIINTGATEPMTYTLPSVAGESAATQATHAAIGTTNKATIKTGVTTYITNTFSSYTYDISMCERDVGTFIDALKFDLRYPGNYKSRLAARYYANAVTGSLEEDMYYLRNGTGVRNQTLQGLTGDLLPPNEYGTSRVSAGAYASLDPGWGPDDFRTWIISRSPYVQNVCTFGTGAIGQKIDGALHNGGNDSIVSNDFTQIISDGIGAWVTNNGRAELVSVFTYYSHIGYLAENGGRIRGTNGNNSYGDFGSVAEGFDSDETPILCEVDNKAFVATVGHVSTNGVDYLYQFEYDNAGTDYTSVTWTVSGGGSGAEIEQDDFRDGAVYQVRLLDNVDDSTTAPEADGNYGGSGYISNANTAQAGTTSQLTLAAVDDEITGAYVGMKLIITSGTGAGQVGIVDTYTAGTKVATVVKESTGLSGWDHLVPGTAIVAPDASSTYLVEPRVTLTGPTYSSTARTLATAQTYSDATYAPTFAVYEGVSGSTSGSGTSATFTVVRKGTKYLEVDIVNTGTFYERLDTITIAGTSLGGASTTNDVTITITAVEASTGAIQAFKFSGVGAGGKFVAVSSGSRTTNTSINGTAWSENLLSLPSTSNWISVAAGALTVVETAGSFVTGRAYVITSLGNTVFTSIGATSNLVGAYFVATGAGSGSGTATPIANHLVAVSSSTTVNAYSADGGVSWTAGGSLPGGISGTAIEVAYGRYNGFGRWIVIGTGGATAYSTNGGVSWTAGGALPSGTWASVTYGQGVWVAVSTGATTTAYSADGGATWTAGGALPASSTWTSVKYGNNKFVAVSSDGTVSPAYSVDKGVTWSNTGVAGWLNQTVENLRYGQGVFVAVNSTSNNMVSSEDGINWTTRAITRASGTGALVAVQGNPNQTGIWAIIPSASTTAASSANIGATAKARAYVADNKIYAIRVSDPGSAYSTAPTITITDPNNLYEAPTTVRIGNGACANVSFIDRGLGYDSAIAEQDTGDGYADNFQSGKFMAVRRLTGVPRAGANVVFSTQPNTVYKLVNVLSQSGSVDGDRGAFLQISPDMTVFDSPADGTDITTRIRYSQVRLTGHDFLDIGTGNFTETNYPGLPTQIPVQANETVDNNGGRVFYTSTDQDGNFRVGELFTIEQSTGVATLNADAFNIAGLSELSLGNITLGGNSATITEFSTDPFLTANSDNVVPTQRAIKAYIAAQIGGGGASLNVNSIVAGFIEIAGTRITTTTGGTIQMKANFNFQAGVRGYPVAWNYFLNN